MTKRKAPEDKLPMGRPPKFRESFIKIAEKACLLGATDQDLAEIFQVNVLTINRWKKDHPDFCNSLKAKSDVDDKVEAALLSRALGCAIPETKVLANNQNPHDPVMIEGMKHYAPDTTACMMWLSNRRPEKWRRDPSGETAQKPSININIVDPRDNQPQPE